MSKRSNASYSTQKMPKNQQQLKSILSKRHQTGEIKVIFNGMNLTPEPLNPFTVARIKEKSVDKKKDEELSSYSSTTNILFSQSTSRFHSELHQQALHAESIYLQSYISGSFVDDVFIEPETVEPDYTDTYGQDEYIDTISDAHQTMVSHVSLVLKETTTIHLFEILSKTVDKNSKEATAVEEENFRYEYLTDGKGRNRKMVNAEIQTVQILVKSRTTGVEKLTFAHNHTFASEWDMFDTYEEQKEKKEVIFTEYLEDELTQSVVVDPVESSEISDDERQLSKLLQNENFLEALCVIERLLANNNYNEEQKRFRGLSDPDSFREDIKYKYRLNLLWTFANKETNNRCVTALSWNKYNADILAAAYGTFNYNERKTGMVMLWNIKNPVQPERVYRFEHPVTAINFSKQNPNLLAVGFYNGSIQLVDVSSRVLRIIGFSTSDSPLFEPIWQVIWFEGSDYFKHEEQVIAGSQDGRISYYRTQDNLELIYSQIMRIARPEGKLKGIKILRRCNISSNPISRYAAVLVLQQHPADPNLYYVGTSEGTIHKCSRNYYYQHLDLFLAHNGPMYEMRFSPFCNKLFITCGDDWYVRLWADGITEPLFEFTEEMQSIQSADWSPTHSTIIANVCGLNIYIWDIQRKIYKPQSVTKNPLNCRNTIIRFTDSGRCLIVGDVEGNIHVFALEDMPFSPIFQDDFLLNSIIRCLVTKPDLIEKLKKMGNLSF